MREFLHSRFRVFCVLAFIGCAVYANAIGNPFVHDDVVFIQQNPNIVRWDNIADVFLRPNQLSDLEAVRAPYYRPLLEVLYRVEFLAFGMSPAGFHAFNVILHVVNAFLVFLLGASLRLPRFWSLCVALVFLVHPVQSEAVACVSGISNLIVAFFCLGSILSYVRARQRLMRRSIQWSFLTGILFLLALFSKEQAVVVPIVLAAYEFLWRKEASRTSSRWTLLGALFGILAAYCVWRQVVFPGMISGVWENPGELLLRVTSIPRMILDYGGAIFWPSGLHYYRSLDILLPKLVPALWFVSIVCLIIAACLSLPGRRRRWAWLGIAWFIITLLPVLNIVPLINEYSFVLTAEHFLYLPLVGLLIFCGAAVGAIPRAFRREISAAFFRVLLVLILVMSGAMTVRQNFFWRGEIPLFERTLLFEPGFGRVHLLLARAYAKAGRCPEALGEYAMGLRIMEDYVKKAGHSKAREVYLGYIQETYFRRGECYRAMGRLPESNGEYLWALGVRTASRDMRGWGSRAANNLALNFILMGERVRAKRFLELALQLDPHNIQGMNNLGMFFSEQGEKKMAAFWFERAIKRDPLFRAAWENLKRVQNY